MKGWFLLKGNTSHVLWNFIWLIMSRKVNVCVVIRLQARQWRFGIQLSGGGETAFYCRVQTVSVAQPAFCPVGNGGFFWGGGGRSIVGAYKVKKYRNCTCMLFLLLCLFRSTQYTFVVTVLWQPVEHNLHLLGTHDYHCILTITWRFVHRLYDPASLEQLHNLNEGQHSFEQGLYGNHTASWCTFPGCEFDVQATVRRGEFL